MIWVGLVESFHIEESFLEKARIVLGTTISLYWLKGVQKMSAIFKTIPHSEFKSNPQKWFPKGEEVAGPILVTLHGRGLFVAQSLEMYGRLHQWAWEGQRQVSINRALQADDEDDFMPAPDHHER